MRRPRGEETRIPLEFATNRLRQARQEAGNVGLIAGPGVLVDHLQGKLGAGELHEREFRHLRCLFRAHGVEQRDQVEKVAFRVLVGREQAPIAGNRLFIHLQQAGEFGNHLPVGGVGRPDVRLDDFKRRQGRPQVAGEVVALRDRHRIGEGGPEFLLQDAPRVKGELVASGALGQLRQPLQHGATQRAACARLDERDGVVRLPQALVDADDLFQEFHFAGSAVQFVAQHRQQRVVVKQPPGQAQHGFPAGFVTGHARMGQPLGQRNLRGAAPLGHLGKALAPFRRLRHLGNRRLRDLVGISQIGRREKDVETEQVNLVVERQARPRAACIDAPGSGHGVTSCGECMRESARRPGHEDAALLHRQAQAFKHGHAQQPLGVTLRGVGAIGGLRGARQELEGFGIVGQRAEVAVGLANGFVIKIARHQGAHSGHVVLTPCRQANRLFLRAKVELRRHAVAAKPEQQLGRLGIGLHRARLSGLCQA